jgi:hypothetical protein
MPNLFASFFTRKAALRIPLAPADIRWYRDGRSSLLAIAKGLPSSSITTLEISNSAFHELEILQEMLTSVANSKVIDLNLNDNWLGSEHVTLIASALEGLKLTHLSLTRNVFKKADFARIISACKCTTLRHLDIHGDAVAWPEGERVFNDDFLGALPSLTPNGLEVQTAGKICV